MVHRISKKSLYILGSKDSKTSKLWGDLSEDRKHRQHPHGIGEDDAHAIPKYTNPTLREPVSEEEQDIVVHSLEDQVQFIKDREEANKKKEEPKEELEDWID